jgi:cell division protein FtsN
MANDMKPKASPRGGGGKPGVNPLFAGIIIGLLMGIFLALGVAIWLKKTANPFVEKTRPVDTLPAAKPASGASAAGPVDGKADPSNPDKPRFEFYQILPGEKGGASKNPAEAVMPKTPPAPKEPVKEAVKETPKETPKEATPVKSLNETLYLQAGAFQSEAEAENLKAKIAFSGFEASIKAVNVAGKGTLYRVRLGPYKSQDEVNRIKGVLSQNGIGAAVVKQD